MEGNIRSILDDPDYYAIIYKIMKREMLPVSKWTDELFNNRIAAKLSVQNRDLKFLGVGSGSGEVELMNTLQLLKKFPKISITAIEPAKDHIDEYKELVKKESSKVEGVSYSWRQQTLNEYRDEVGTTKKYDVIVAINSAYYFDDIEDTLMYMHDILEEGGILLLVLASENGVSYRIWSRFSAFYKDFSFKKICSVQLTDVLKNLNLDYETARMRSGVNVTECFKDSSQEGQHLIDFLSHVVHLRESVSSDFYTEFISFLKDSSNTNGSDDTSLFMQTEQEAIFVQK
ncbi:histamine N-methyltransferase-like [Anneissia japonica]|uniref:histamine N-methyltransferase-like n=1 Tax=Anneissia japonica TaxID=1529436 RepID=UPI0014259CBA|nr:histamine N-methyltransferase-like [Anneissia japonica]